LLLSAFQAITVSPSNSKWAFFKSNLFGWVSPSLLFFWITNLLIYIQTILLKQANSNSTVLGSGYSQASCQTQPLEHNHLIALTIVTVIVDVFCVVVMICTWCISSTHTTGEPSISTVPASPSSHLLKTKQSTVLFSY
jgi:vomeronasal1 receptor